MNLLQILEFFVALTVQSAFMVAACHWTGRLADNEHTRSRMWATCYAIILALFSVAILLPHVRLTVPWPQQSQSLRQHAAFLEVQVVKLLLAVWLSGCLISAARLTYGSIQVTRFLRTCQPIDLIVCPSVPLSLPSVSEQQMEIRGRPVQIVCSSAISSPFCWQFHRPYIVLPTHLGSCTVDRMTLILRHELHHLQSGHPLQLFIQHLVEILFWYHPVIWRASRQAALAREFACDDEAIQDPSNTSAYLKTLLSIVEQDTRNTATPSPTLGLVRHHGMLAERARRLVEIANRSADGTGGIAGTTRRFPIPTALLACAAVIATFLWLPIDVRASTIHSLSPWPSWTATVLHNFGVEVMDFETDDYRYDSHELEEHRQQ